MTAGHDVAGPIDAGEDQDLARESGQARQAERRERRQDDRSGQPRIARAQAAKTIEQARLFALLRRSPSTRKSAALNKPCAMR